MEIQDRNAKNFYSSIAIAREAFAVGEPISKVDFFLSVASSYYFKTPEESRASDMRKEIDSLEVDVSNWRYEG
ncbi:hypothetical protein K8R30_00130 [archaeon]|nr:hypothetical protein [archaeon]